MPYSDELGREYTLDEARFWREAQFAAKNDPASVRLIPIGQPFGYSEQRIGQIGRTWENDALCVTTNSGRVLATLTPFGERFTFEESYGDIEG
jgi:hypothetical protein